MNTLSKIATGLAGLALVALLGLPIAGAAGGDGAGPAPGAGQQVEKQNGNQGVPCYGPGGGPGRHHRGYYRNCGGPCPQHRGCGPCQGPEVQRRGCGPCQVPGQGQGPGQGRGGFVDKDGDGICDYHPDNGKGSEPDK